MRVVFEPGYYKPHRGPWHRFSTLDDGPIFPAQSIDVAGAIQLKEEAARKQKEELLREAHCWQECEANGYQNPLDSLDSLDDIDVGLCRFMEVWLLILFIEVCVLIHKYYCIVLVSVSIYCNITIIHGRSKTAWCLSPWRIAEDIWYTSKHPLITIKNHV